MCPSPTLCSMPSAEHSRQFNYLISLGQAGDYEAQLWAQLADFGPAILNLSPRQQADWQQACLSLLSSKRKSCNATPLLSTV